MSVSENMPITRRQLEIIAAYDKAHSHTTYVTHTMHNSKFGGVSVEFVMFVNTNADAVELKYANGDRFIAPLSEITIRVQF